MKNYFLWWIGCTCGIVPLGLVIMSAENIGIAVLGLFLIFVWAYTTIRTRAFKDMSPVKDVIDYCKEFFKEFRQ